MQPLLMLPSCSKKDEEGTIKLIHDANSKVMGNNGYPLINVCTDGGGTRRRVANRLVHYKVDELPWFTHISNLPLLDYDVGLDGII